MRRLPKRARAWLVVAACAAVVYVALTWSQFLKKPVLLLPLVVNGLLLVALLLLPPRR